jgi:DNA replicative helicase MCM subunit Mcm2 (Cdc46/Mcm family)
VKTAVALALFGGCHKEDKGHRVRGDINILLLGKTQPISDLMICVID